jgi:hypothetical protein
VPRALRSVSSRHAPGRVRSDVARGALLSPCAGSGGRSPARTSP